MDKSPSIKKSKKIARERPPIDPKMIDFHFPPVALRKLSNGLKLLVVERHDLPKIYFRVGLQYGKKYDRPEQAGLSELLSATLKKGTRLRDYESIVETIDAAGGELETAISEDFFFAFGDFLKEYFQVGLEILSEILRQPSFPEMEFRKEQMKLLANLENEKSSPPYLAHRQMNQLIYRPHPYYLHKTKDSIQAISQSDLAGIHRQYFNPEQMLVVVAGDVDEQEAVDGIEKHFSDWPAAARSEILFEIPRYLNSRQIHLVDRPGSAQVNILLGNPLFPRRHPDYEKMLVMNKILGGGGSGRLFLSLREEKGYTYGAYSSMQTYQQAGAFVANAEVRPEVTSDAIHAFFEQFDKIKNEAVSDDDLVNAKRYLIGSFPLQNESPAAIAGLALKIQLYDLPADYWDFYLKAIDETGKEDITEMARKYIREDRMGIVVVGDAAKLESQLSPLGKLKIFDMEGREIIDR